MKKILAVVLAFLTAFTVTAQQKTHGVFITVTGNRNLQITIDGTNYNLRNSNVAGNITTIAINNPGTGQHNIEFTRTTQNNQTERTSTIFNLRYGFDMLIKLNADGSVELIETRNSGYDNSLPMSASNFNNLLRNERKQKSAMARREVVASALNNTKNYFTTAQVSQLLQLVNSETFRLQLAKLAYRSITDRANFYQVYDLLNSQNSKDDLETYVNNYNQENDFNNEMSDADFNILYQGIRQQSSVSTQMNSLIKAFNNTNNFFSSYQASQLIQIINGDNNRLQLAKLSYRSITDRSNFNQVSNLLYSQSSRNELETFVDNYNTGIDNSNTNIAMSDADFNSLYQTVQYQFFPNQRMSTLTDIFNNKSNFFTCAQAKQLIPLVTMESNRLQLAKLSYRSIVDRGNFSQLYELLESQASRNDLDAYVKAYRD